MNKHLEPAFPTNHFSVGENWIDGGMTLRDYFAAKAMQGMLAGPVGGMSAESLSRWAYQHADAMLAERAK